MPSIELSVRIYSHRAILDDDVSDAMDAMGDNLRANILWEYKKTARNRAIRSLDRMSETLDVIA